ncbi:unnamed protein product [Dracunculus medinensis]|uniref:BHLH domain-containing protein n=1 Tax=Dracunculus medinensis TaxID=318479 RepID=A0A158Q615_DRAME|nr:unnamed protein product [Dracunculus medinensis]
MLSGRDRGRQQDINEAFNQLREIIPCYPVNRKMSKQEILRGAIRYMKILEYLLECRHRWLGHVFRRKSQELTYISLLAKPCDAMALDRAAWRCITLVASGASLASKDKSC